MILAGWYSLKYGWGIEPKNMGALLVYYLVAVLGWPIGLAWVQRAEKNKEERG